MQILPSKAHRNVERFTAAIAATPVSTGGLGSIPFLWPDLAHFTLSIYCIIVRQWWLELPEPLPPWE
jgi:hypothetical protein